MARSSAGLFASVHQADFYQTMMNNAIDLLPHGAGRSLLDVGCGPGLMTRVADQRGYQALGIDTDQDMILAAKGIARKEQSGARFTRRVLDDVPVLPRADVVVGASLLAVLDDQAVALRQLWQHVSPSGHLLIIEATNEMTLRRARQLIAIGDLGRRSWLLALWASARQGRTVNPQVFGEIGDDLERRFVPLLHGLVGAWIFQRAT